MQEVVSSNLTGPTKGFKELRSVPPSEGLVSGPNSPVGPSVRGASLTPRAGLSRCCTWPHGLGGSSRLARFPRVHFGDGGFNDGTDHHGPRCSRIRDSSIRFEPPDARSNTRRARRPTRCDGRHDLRESDRKPDQEWCCGHPRWQDRRGRPPGICAGSQRRSNTGLLRTHGRCRALEQPCAPLREKVGRHREYSSARTRRPASSDAHAIRLHQRVRSRVALGKHAADPRAYRVWRDPRSENPLDGRRSDR